MKQTAIKAAKEAGKILLKLYQKNISIKNKKNTYNLVTEADLKSERVIVSIIKKKFPSHSFLTEEETVEKTSSEYLWVIDPLDGTNNYSHGFPFFCVSIGLYKNNKPLLGVVYDPLRKELFYAEKGKGAFLNNKKIKVSKSKKITDCIFVTGFYYERGSLMKRTLKNMEDFFRKNVRGIRRTGSAALDLCYVASGRLEGYWELKISPWDFAAGALIVEEAGGKVTDVNGAKYNLSMISVLASNKKIHNSMLKTIK